MSTAASAVAVDFIAKTAKFRRDVKKINKTLGQTKKILEGAKKSIKSFFAIIGAGIGAAVLVQLTKNVLNFGDSLNKISLRLGASVEELSAYAHVANLSGVAFRGFSISLQRQTRRIAEAADGTGEAKLALKQLGLSAKELIKLIPTKQFEAISVAMGKISNKAKKVQLAFKMWDAEGVTNLQIVKQGTEAIKRMKDEARALGLVLSTEQAQAMADANNEMTRFKAVLQGVAQTIILELIPPLTDMLKVFIQAAKESNGFRTQITAAISAIKIAAQILAVFLFGKFVKAVTAAIIALKAFSIAATIAKVSVAGWFGIIAGGLAAMGLFISETNGAASSVRGLNDALKSTEDNVKKVKLETITATIKELQEVTLRADGHIKNLMAAPQSEAVIKAIQKYKNQLINASIEIGVELEKQNELLNPTAKKASIDVDFKKLEDAEKLVKSINAQMATPEAKILITINKLNEALKLGAFGDGVEGIKNHAAAIEFVTDKYHEATPEVKKFNDMQKEAKRIVEDTRTPLEQYNVLVANYSELAEVAGWSTEQWARAMALASEQAFGISDAIEQIHTPLQRLQETFANIGENITAGIGNSISSAIVDSENLNEALKNVAKQGLRQIISAMVQYAIKQALVGKIAKAEMLSTTATSVASAGATTAAWAPAAGLTNAATFGSSAIAGLAALAAIMVLARGFGKAHAGVTSVPEDQTVMMKRGERVIETSQNRDLTRFLSQASNDRVGPSPMKKAVGHTIIYQNEYTIPIIVRGNNDEQLVARIAPRIIDIIRDNEEDKGHEF